MLLVEPHAARPSDPVVTEVSQVVALLAARTVATRLASSGSVRPKHPLSSARSWRTTGRHPDPTGVLVIDSAEMRRFSDHHAKLVEAVAANLATLLRLVRLSQLRERELEALKRASEVKSIFLSAVSHELRTPLTVIRGMSATLHRRGRKLDVETAGDLIARLHRNAQKLERLLLDLLDMCRDASDPRHREMRRGSGPCGPWVTL